MRSLTDYSSAVPMDRRCVNNNNNNNNNNLTFILRLKHATCKLKGPVHCTSAKRMSSILRHVAEAFPPARQGTILNSHWVTGIATNTSMVLNCALVAYIIITANIGLPDVVQRHTQDQLSLVIVPKHWIVKDDWFYIVTAQLSNYISCIYSIVYYVITWYI